MSEKDTIKLLLTYYTIKYKYIAIPIWISIPILFGYWLARVST